MTDHISTVTFTAEDLTRLIKIEAWAKAHASIVAEVLSDAGDDGSLEYMQELGISEARSMTPREELLKTIRYALNPHLPAAENAEAILAAIEAHSGGLVISPKRPTDDMNATVEEHVLNEDDMFEQMIAASPYAPQQKE